MAEEMMRLFAYVSKDVYESFKKGEIVSNNGFRTRDGAFNPIQPQFVVPSDTTADQLKAAAVKGAAMAITYLTAKYGKELGDFAAQKVKWAYGEYIAPLFEKRSEAKHAEISMKTDETETKLKLVEDINSDVKCIRQAV